MCPDCVRRERPVALRSPSPSIQPLFRVCSAGPGELMRESVALFRSMRECALAAEDSFISFKRAMPVQNDEVELDRLRWAFVAAQRAAQAFARAAVATKAGRPADAKAEAADANRILTSILARTHLSDFSSGPGLNPDDSGDP